MTVVNLDMDVLRTLVAAQRLGGFNRAAEQIGRSQSAVSQQIHKLEERVGLPLFRKQGRSLELTEAGETVLAYARRILELNDEAVTAVRGASVEGIVRFGMPGDFAETWLPMALGRFKRAHPAVRVEAMVDRSAVLLERLDKGQLDLVVTLGTKVRGDTHPIATLPMAWIGPANGELPWRAGEPVPLAMFEAPCTFRHSASYVLDEAGIPWTIAFTSPSLPGLWAAVAAGLGITIRTAAGLPDTLRVLGVREGLPRLPTIELAMHDASRELAPQAQRLKEIMLQVLADNLAAISGAKLAPRKNTSRQRKARSRRRLRKEAVRRK
jgi:DNA-binding transcriptional LysR family regulator